MKTYPQKSSKSRSTLPPIPAVDVMNKTPQKNTGIVKEELILKILKYQHNKRFGPIINKELGFKYTRSQLTKQNIDHLQTILHRIRTHLNTRNLDRVFQHMVQVSAKGYEDLVSGFGYDIEGFSELLLQNPAFHDAFERWKIERKVIDIPPSFQLMYIVASTTYMAHSIKNRDKPPEQPQSLPPVKEEPSTRIKTKHQPGDFII